MKDGDLSKILLGERRWNNMSGLEAFKHYVCKNCVSCDGCHQDAEITVQQKRDKNGLASVDLGCEMYAAVQKYQEELVG